MLTSARHRQRLWAVWMPSCCLWAKGQGRQSVERRLHSDVLLWLSIASVNEPLGRTLRNFTWEEWAGPIEKAAVTALGQPVLAWAIDVLRGLFGESWLADSAARSQTIPLLRPDWYPLANPRAVVGVLEFAVRVALVKQQEGAEALLAEAGEVRSNRDATLREFQHLLLGLEVAAFAVMDGWKVSYEQQLPSGRKPDLWLSRNGLDYLIETTVIGFDRDFRSIESWTDGLRRVLQVLESRHEVETVAQLDEVLDEADTEQWILSITAAALATGEDGKHRTVRAGECSVQVFAKGERPPGPILTGPALTNDAWLRVATRIASKIKQTSGGPPAWLRIDDVGTLFHLTDWSARPLAQRLHDLSLNIGVALADAHHIRGVILSGGVEHAARSAAGETAWQDLGRLLGQPPQTQPSRQQLAYGPVALRRILPGQRQRMVYVIPTRQTHLVLPAGTGLEPGLWYSEEASWPDMALRRLGHPPLAEIIREPSGP
ncbi:hypothetical protein J5U46_07925 [Micromonospora tulbaghiae]|uniref:Uncharacterized protein n=1 Tax=Micromonospora tulbaghiae TaxID=479978 RepID=A0AAW4JMP2_9ACTN|nr:hypothetical protein [Micromonospora tulbaghiae]MBO4140071.1 hypothetical protein [Micromonospora tulbaghiae]